MGIAYSIANLEYSASQGYWRYRQQNDNDPEGFGEYLHRVRGDELIPVGQRVYGSQGSDEDREGRRGRGCLVGKPGEERVLSRELNGQIVGGLWNWRVDMGLGRAERVYLSHLLLAL